MPFLDPERGLAFGNSNPAREQPTNACFFAARPNDENDGLSAVSRRQAPALHCLGRWL